MDIDALEVRVKTLEENYKANAESRREIYKRLSKLEQDASRTDEKYKRIMTELDEQKRQLNSILEKLESMSEKPAKRWDAAMASIVSAVIAAVVGFIAAQIKGG